MVMGRTSGGGQWYRGGPSAPMARWSVMRVMVNGEYALSMFVNDSR